jgi:hypothetical protein
MLGACRDLPSPRSSGMAFELFDESFDELPEPCAGRR